MDGKGAQRGIETVAPTRMNYVSHDYNVADIRLFRI